MDRNIVYPGAIPLDTDLLSVQRSALVALGYLAQATLGAGPVVDGLACTPTAPASLTVNVGPGSIAMLSTLDATAFGSLPADNSDPLVKLGINAVGSTAFTLTAPTTSGQSIAYLIQATLQESDASPVVLPYYNASNPAQPYSGPANSGVAQNTQRVQRVQLQLKAGAPATTGTQVTPAVDTGWVGLYVIVVNYGQTQVVAGNIAQATGAPFVPWKLAQLAPGFSRQAVFSGAGTVNWTVPNGVFRVKVRLVGGGAGASGSSGANSGAGGGAGGYSEGVLAVTPGQVIAVTVGGGGAGSASGSIAGSGGTSSFLTISATGGTGGGGAAYAGGAPGFGSGGAINLLGGYGTDGNATSAISGLGGASAFGGGGRGGAGSGANGQAPGSGAGGAYGPTANGGNGATGLVIVEY